MYRLEIKPGISNKKKSLPVYEPKYNPNLLLRISMINFQLDGKTFNIPHLRLTILLSI